MCDNAVCPGCTRHDRYHNQARDQRRHFLRREHLIEARFLDVRILPFSGRIAWFLRLRPCFESRPRSPLPPGTVRKAPDRVLAVGQFARQAR